jgi:HPt (histidine-containing phosphotransfer) domain-containing protein
MATIDWEQFNENFQYYDKETIHEVIDDFLDEAEKRLVKIEQNISGHDYKNLSFNAHSFKSVIGNFMAPEPYELCRKLEELAKQESDESIPAVFAKFKPLIGELVNELKEYKKK